MLFVTRRLLKINNQFGVESSSNVFLAQIILTKHRRFPTRTAEVALVGCKIRKRTLKRRHVLELTLQWSAVLLIQTKARQRVPLTNFENQPDIWLKEVCCERSEQQYKPSDFKLKPWTLSQKKEIFISLWIELKEPSASLHLNREELNDKRKNIPQTELEWQNCENIGLFSSSNLQVTISTRGQYFCFEGKT